MSRVWDEGTSAMVAPAVRASDRDGYVPALDGIRAIAVLAVYLLHLAGAYFPGGAVGVDLFFVLSAFLITGLLMAEFERTGRVRFGDFYLRRAFRLLPALLLWLVLASFTAVMAGEGEKVAWSAAGALFYFNDFQQAWTDRVAAAFNQSWSLSVEEQFYFVWPPLLVLVLLRRSLRVQRWFLHVSVIVAVAVAFTPQNYFLPTGHLLPLVIGCWAADQHAHGRTSWIAAVTRQPWIGAVALTVFAVATLVVYRPLGDVMFVTVAFATAALILNITGDRANLVSRALGSAVPRWVGARSYGIYLYGLTLMHLVPLLIVGIELRFAAPIDIALTILVVALSYRFVESPVRRWGRQWLRDRVQAKPSSAVQLGSS
ncbi:acyltransferase [Microbacterium sp.]|uniref:acyltransferase family protein n=1 Tax=Microbacterium sp. TaxID=51671 RepID=UPI00281268D3|nr:acyltransferase [Microbacterium sp.]